jgi:hypothetical protein
MQKRGLIGMNGFMVFLLTCFSVVAHAQQPGYLILIDAENKQAYTMRIGDQLYTSSGHGHLVLFHLKDSSYRLNLSFPKKNLAEQVFPVVVHQKDLGFQLKGADSSWVLYNWQTKETIRPVIERDSSRILDQGIKREDGFSRLMAAVVNDSSVMYNTYTGNGFNQDSSTEKTVKMTPPAGYVTVISEKKTGKYSLVAERKTDASKDSLLLVAKQNNSLKDSLLAAKKATPINDNLLATKKTTPVKDSLVKGKHAQLVAGLTPGVKKLREVSLKISRKMVYLDIGRDGHADTVTLFVFFENPDTLPGKLGNEPLALKKPAIPSCTQLATEEDVQSLRSAILKANTDLEKISVASGAFALKCFSVSQIRFLAALFVSDKSRYRLMDIAHLHIADHDHFHELVDMLTDKNFQRKFLVLAEKRS